MPRYFRERKLNTKIVTKHLHFSIFLIFSFSFSCAYADTGNNQTNATSPKKPVSWLFVITAKDGEIKKNAQSQYMLTLEHVKIERVLAFSDRPNRIVKIISPEQFKSFWSKGTNSFQKDPPNAIAVFDQKTLSMKLISVRVDKNKTSFVVTSDDAVDMPDLIMGDVSVFIDNIKTIGIDNSESMGDLYQPMQN
jgi:hypothetical protein